MQFVESTPAVLRSADDAQPTLCNTDEPVSSKDTEVTISPASNVTQFDVFPWNKNFETGHPEIDAQHKVLVQLLNNLANTLTTDQPDKVNEAFDKLAAYADYHFETEEVIWNTYFGDDHWYASHQLRHASFLPKVIEMKAEENNKPLEVVIEDIVKFLIRWLAFHIIDDDKRMAIAAQGLDDGLSLADAKALSDRKMNGSIRILIETVMMMYDGLSSRTLSLMREHHSRLKIETELREANAQLETANKQLATLSITDQLTALFNRRHFDQVIHTELRRAQRDGSVLRVILFDIDHFKKINDTYGHASGDAALQQVGHCLKTVCRRPGDFAFRLGGEEFALIETQAALGNETVLAEILRAEIETLAIPNRHSPVAEVMTISAGVVTVADPHAVDVDAIMRIVDNRLYAAKSAGRNRVIGDVMSLRH